MSWFPRPVAPKALWADIRAFAAERSRYQWGGMAVALIMPLVIVVGFFYDSAHAPQDGPQVVYVQSWPASRTDAQIVADQKKDQAQREAAQRERQAEFRRLGDQMNRLGI
ncbi:MAG TPA: hypothetical protein VH331_11395 [Allosphingosinicella sp.]|jgi:hypothetical protein|nr:hypothetical protein [Allosphingosinicella sp.]